MGGICTFLPCIVAVFVVKGKILAHPLIRATANNPLIYTVFFIASHYLLKMTNYMFVNKVLGGGVLPGIVKYVQPLSFGGMEVSSAELHCARLSENVDYKFGYI